MTASTVDCDLEEAQHQAYQMFKGIWTTLIPAYDFSYSMTSTTIRLTNVKTGKDFYLRTVACSDGISSFALYLGGHCIAKEHGHGYLSEVWKACEASITKRIRDRNCLNLTAAMVEFNRPARDVQPLSFWRRLLCRLRS